MSGGIYLKLARQAAEWCVNHNALLPAPAYLPSELTHPGACFVSLLENPGRFIRGRYGQPTPRQPNLAQEIIWNTVQAVSQGGRRAIRRVDLAYLAYTVAVLGPLERINGSAHLAPEFYGLYIRSDRDKTALILPQRPGIETGEDQIATALREADINTQQEAISLYRFAVTLHQ